MKLRLLLIISLAMTAAAWSQDVDLAARAARWKQFNNYGFHTLNFSKTKLTKQKIAKLKEDENADDFALLRGVVFGKHGRVFKERSIQDYLDKQPWYKPDPKFSNAVL